MEIDLLRHGAALAAAPGASDTDRALSAEGREQVRDVLERAREAGVKPSLILTSPYLRAVQTAQIAVEILGYAGDVVSSRGLEPERSPFDLWDELRTRGGDGEILLVGHQPLLGDVASILLGKGVGIGTGTMVRIHVPELVPEPAASLQWVIQPGAR